MTEIPSGFITHSERPLNLFRRHSLTRLEQKQHREEPCFERKVCVVKNRLRRDAELVVAFRALKLLLCGELEYRMALAAQTPYTERPAEPFQKFSAQILSLKRPVYINQESCLSLRTRKAS